MTPSPVANIRASDSQSASEKANRTSAAPATAAPNAIVVADRSSERRPDRASVPTSAPQPDAAISHPRVCGPPWRTSAAKTGSRTVYGRPSRVTSATSTRIFAIGGGRRARRGLRPPPPAGGGGGGGGGPPGPPPPPP